MARKSLIKLSSTFSKKVPFLQKWADLHILVGYFSAVVLPLVGFVGSCILVRYKGDYVNCLVANHYVSNKWVDKDFAGKLELVYKQTWKDTSI